METGQVYAFVYITSFCLIIFVLETAWGEKHSLPPSMPTLFLCENDTKFVFKRPWLALLSVRVSMNYPTSWSSCKRQAIKIFKAMGSLCFWGRHRVSGCQLCQMGGPQTNRLAELGIRCLKVQKEVIGLPIIIRLR